MAGLQFGQAHQPDDPVHPATLTQRSKVVPEAWTAVGTVAELEALSDEAGEVHITLRNTRKHHLFSKFSIRGSVKIKIASVHSALQERPTGIAISEVTRLLGSLTENGR